MKISDIIWNMLAPFYFKLRCNSISNYFLKKENRAIRKLLENLVTSNIKTICDLGVGRGHSHITIPKTIPLKIAIDKSLAMINLTRKDFPDTIFIHADVLNLPLINSSIELIFCIGLMEYTPDIESLITQFNCILKNEGYLILSYAPKNAITYLRYLRGHRIYPRNAEDFEIYFRRYQFKILELTNTPMQNQFLLQKIM
jgi:ubiquinone/menaquinone biosynthesis C-methylase UbiE